MSDDESPSNLCTVSLDIALKLGMVPVSATYVGGLAPCGLQLMMAERFHGYRLLWPIDVVLERELRRQGRLTSR